MADARSGSGNGNGNGSGGRTDTTGNGSGRTDTSGNGGGSDNGSRAGASSGGGGRPSLYGVNIDTGQNIGVLRGRSGPIPAADPARTHRFCLAQHPQFLLTYSDDMFPAKIKLRKRITAWPLRLTFR